MSKGVKTSRTVFDILEKIQEMEGATVTELSRELNMAKSTIYKHLTTMTKRGYLTKEDVTYNLSLQFLDSGIYARNRYRIHETAQQELNRLSEDIGEIAWLAVEERGYAVYIEKSRPSQAVQPFARIGMRVPLPEVALGRAILAQMPDSSIDSIIDRHRNNENREYGDLYEKLDTIRGRGYAVNDGEIIDNFRAIASPILGNDSVKGALVIGAPKNRLTGERFERTISNKIMASSDRIELMLQ